MWARRARSGRRNANGVARIRRETYTSVSGGATAKDGWWKIRDEVWARDGGRCRAIKDGKVCGAPAKEVHHIIPLSKGGTNTKANLISLCLSCHDKRHNHLFRARSR
jgi:5-methylcytosine-specific restriction endonuclease McrA